MMAPRNLGAFFICRRGSPKQKIPSFGGNDKVIYDLGGLWQVSANQTVRPNLNLVIPKRARPRNLLSLGYVSALSDQRRRAGYSGNLSLFTFARLTSSSSNRMAGAATLWGTFTILLSTYA